MCGLRDFSGEAYILYMQSASWYLYHIDILAQAFCFTFDSSETLAESSQDLQRSAWLEGKDGGLPGREQAKAWALREMWRDTAKEEFQVSYQPV